eukprot:Nk52_evm17s230 gene=Nk52_evmTU17s230
MATLAKCENPYCKLMLGMRPTDFIVLECGVLDSSVNQSTSGCLILDSVLKNADEIRYVIADSPLHAPLAVRERRAPVSSISADGSQGDLVGVLGAEHLWRENIRGKGVRVAVFDSGVAENHPHFHAKGTAGVVKRKDFTEEGFKGDGDLIGHGTFVCGLIASRAPKCRGLAPEASVYMYKVFTSEQKSYTSWLLGAFNEALLDGIQVINLSVGGPDFHDYAFLSKVWEVTASGVVVVSAIGNDGPLYGTLANPGDQSDVIGIGGVTWIDSIATYSSRGMTTWEITSKSVTPSPSLSKESMRAGRSAGGKRMRLGYGRLKPDVVTYSFNLCSSASFGDNCRLMSGTSMASPVVAGAIALLISAIPKNNPVHRNPMAIKQILMASAVKLPNPMFKEDDFGKGSRAFNMFEQGQGKLNLKGAHVSLAKYTPHISLVPPYIDMTEVPYMWPFSGQPLYFGAVPKVVNVTVLNAVNEMGKISVAPIFVVEEVMGNVVAKNANKLVQIEFEYSSQLWPWSGYIALFITVTEEGEFFKGTLKGNVELTVWSKGANHSASLPMLLDIVPRPNREKRILWDQFHNLGYPSGYFPRDNLRIKTEALDRYGDHIHTNFNDMYNYLRHHGFFIEILTESFLCFDAEQYGTLLIVDSEEEFFEEERVKLAKDVQEFGLGVVIFSDWYNTHMMKAIEFFDDNTQTKFEAETGGSNIPAINDLLQPFDIAFTDMVVDGGISVEEDQEAHAGQERTSLRSEKGSFRTIVQSGTTIGKFPKGGWIGVHHLVDVVEEMVNNIPKVSVFKPILGMYQVKQNNNTSNMTNSSLPGRIAVFGDSSCLDSAGLKVDCFWLLHMLLLFSGSAIAHPSLKVSNEHVEAKLAGMMYLTDAYVDPDFKDVNRLPSTLFHKYSKVIENQNPIIYSKTSKEVCFENKNLKKKTYSGPPMPSLMKRDSWMTIGKYDNDADYDAPGKKRSTASEREESDLRLYVSALFLCTVAMLVVCRPFLHRCFKYLCRRRENVFQRKRPGHFANESQRQFLV